MSARPDWDRVSAPWTDAATQRVERDLAVLRGAVVWRARRRMVARLGLAAAPVVALVWGVAVVVSGPRDVEAPPVAATFVPAAAPVENAVLVTMVSTDARVAERAAMAPARVDRIGDEELRAALREAGVDSGLVRVGERVMIAGDLVQRTGPSGS
jgi:hypothetical protein